MEFPYRGDAKAVKRRIESRTSRTAEWICMSRALSFLEENGCFKSDDYIAPSLLPTFLRILFRISYFRRLFVRKMPAKGIYEYVIARTKYIDAVFKEALARGFGQIVLFGAGFDTRALRFSNQAGDAKVFELDAPATQEAKIGQYHRRGFDVPASLVFVPIDFEREPIRVGLEKAGFDKEKRSLFILEGVLMYLQPESVHETFRAMQGLAAAGSEIVFDYVYASVLRGEGGCYGEKGMVETVSKAGEGWRFGIEKGGANSFLAEYRMYVADEKDSAGLEEAYFKDCAASKKKTADNRLGRVNGTHCLVRAVVG